MGRIFRIIVVTVLIVFALRALRMIWAALTGGGSVQARTGSQPGRTGKPPADAVPTSGVLRKCGHCGVYISEALALKEASGAELVFYCSTDCQKLGRA